jgi:sulfite reductase subunit B
MAHKMENLYRPVETEVVEAIQETPTIRTIRVRPKERMSFVTGQFMEITIPGVGEIPATPSSNQAATEILQFTIMKVGKVTTKIHELKAGDTIGLRGPLGVGYPVDSFKDKDVVIVGGGCGFAPLRSLMYELFNRSGQFKSLYFRGGCKSPKEMVYRKEMEEWGKREDLNLRLTVDKGDETWGGNVGVVTTILNDINVKCREAIGVVCGPPIMMKFAAKKMLEMGFQENRLFLSMEKNMSCGVGKCGHCRLGTFYCCKDGPVFTYDRIKNFHEIWD